MGRGLSSSAPVLARQAAEPRHPDGVEVLAGDLVEISLPSLLFLVQQEVLDGWLNVGQRGVVALRKGQIVSVRCGALRGHDALKELIFHRGGRFSIIRGELRDADEDGPHVANPTLAMMDAYRLLDEWARLQPQVLRIHPGKPWRPTGGPLDLVVGELDGRRSLAEICRAQLHPLTLLIDPLLAAITGGLLVRSAGAAPVSPQPQPQPQPQPPPPPPVDFYDLVERGRECVRRGQFTEAYTLLTQALALRPDDRVVQQNVRALTQRLRQT